MGCLIDRKMGTHIWEWMWYLITYSCSFKFWKL